MCYSAMVEQRFKALIRRHKARIDMQAFAKIYERRLKDKSIKIPRAMDANFDLPESPIERRIKACVDQFREEQAMEWEECLFSQITHLAAADRALSKKGKKESQKALEDRQIAADKITWCQDRLGELRSSDLKEDDSRIFPMWYAPVIVMENGQYVVKPMRYQCRPNGKPDWYDKKFHGLYNARRDSLDIFWKDLFGKNHGFFVATSFYENVALHRFEKRPLRPDEEPGNLVLHFNPKLAEPMLLACLWDHWTEPGKPDLLSFAAITDDPPEEVAATGHDRCIVALKPRNVWHWLNPQSADKKKLYAILKDRERPYYEHRLAA